MASTVPRRGSLSETGLNGTAHSPAIPVRGFRGLHLYNLAEICITLVSIAIKASKEIRAWTQWKEPPTAPGWGQFDGRKMGSASCGRRRAIKTDARNRKNRNARALFVLCNCPGIRRSSWPASVTRLRQGHLRGWEPRSTTVASDGALSKAKKTP